VNTLSADFLVQIHRRRSASGRKGDICVDRMHSFVVPESDIYRQMFLQHCGLCCYIFYTKDIEIRIDLSVCRVTNIAQDINSGCARNLKRTLNFVTWA